MFDIQKSYTNMYIIIYVYPKKNCTFQKHSKKEKQHIISHHTPLKSNIATQNSHV